MNYFTIFPVRLSTFSAALMDSAIRPAARILCLSLPFCLPGTAEMITKAPVGLCRVVPQVYTGCPLVEQTQGTLEATMSILIQVVRLQVQIQAWLKLILIPAYGL